MGGRSVKQLVRAGTVGDILRPLNFTPPFVSDPVRGNREQVIPVLR